MLPDAPVIEFAFDFAFDFASTASLLALKPTSVLADDLGVAVEWRPCPPIWSRISSLRPPTSANDPLASRRKRRAGAPVASHEATCARLQVPQVP